MKRSGIKPKRSNPRRRPAPRWTFPEWEAANQTLAIRSGGVCEWCSGPGPFERHHRKRRRDGGDRLANILILCRPCHQYTTEHPMRAREVGLIVSVSRDPSQVPFLHHRTEWVWLNDAGEANPLFDLPENADAHDVWA